MISLFEAWRLYEDVDRAFFYGTVPGEDGAYEYLPSLLPGSNGVAAIGTPSRLYYPKSESKPLNGVRVAVKDLYDIKGLKTSMGNRSALLISAAVLILRLVSELGCTPTLLRRLRQSLFSI